MYVPLDTFLLEICAFVIGFSFSMWTKLRSLAGSLADGVLADAISPPTNTWKVRGYQRLQKLKMPVSA